MRCSLVLRMCVFADAFCWLVFGLWEIQRCLFLLFHCDSWLIMVGCSSRVGSFLVAGLVNRWMVVCCVGWVVCLDLVSGLFCIGLLMCVCLWLLVWVGLCCSIGSICLVL